MSSDALVLSREQVRRVDRIAIEQFKVPGIVLMENAARGVTDVVWEEMLSDGFERVAILCGGGNNGGDGLAVARHLHNYGAKVIVGLFGDPAKYAGDALINWQIVQAMKLPTFPVSADTIGDLHADLIVDAIYGTGLTSPPRDPFPEVVEAVRESGMQVIAVDLPSGLDCDTGKPLSETIGADMTVTFVARKKGFDEEGSEDFTGEVVVADIGCPREAIELAMQEA